MSITPPARPREVTQHHMTAGLPGSPQGVGAADTLQSAQPNAEQQEQTTEVVGPTFSDLFSGVLKGAKTLFFWIHEDLFMSFAPDPKAEEEQDVQERFLQLHEKWFAGEKTWEERGLAEDNLKEDLRLLPEETRQKLILDVTGEEMELNAFMIWLLHEEEGNRLNQLKNYLRKPNP